MINFLKRYFTWTRGMVVFWLLLSGGLMAYSAYMPPKGVVDSSVVMSVGVLFLGPALVFAEKALDEGKGIKVKHGDTEVEVRQSQDEEK